MHDMYRQWRRDAILWEPQPQVYFYREPLIHVCGGALVSLAPPVYIGDLLIKGTELKIWRFNPNYSDKIFLIAIIWNSEKDFSLTTLKLFDVFRSYLTVHVGTVHHNKSWYIKVLGCFQRFPVRARQGLTLPKFYATFEMIILVYVSNSNESKLSTGST